MSIPRNGRVRIDLPPISPDEAAAVVHVLEEIMHQIVVQYAPTIEASLVGPIEEIPGVFKDGELPF